MDGTINVCEQGAKANLVGGRDITILEQLRATGGSLDGFGTPEHGYVLRGGRMLKAKYLCTLGLFASIPTLDGRMSVTQEIEQWNRTMPTSPKSRLVRDGRRQTAGTRAKPATTKGRRQ